MVKAKELQKFSIRFSQIALQEEKGSSSGILAFSDFEYNQNEIEKLWNIKRDKEAPIFKFPKGQIGNRVSISNSDVRFHSVLVDSSLFRPHFDSSMKLWTLSSLFRSFCPTSDAVVEFWRYRQNSDAIFHFSDVIAQVRCNRLIRRQTLLSGFGHFCPISNVIVWIRRQMLTTGQHQVL